MALVLVKSPEPLMTVLHAHRHLRALSWRAESNDRAARGPDARLGEALVHVVPLGTRANEREIERE